VSAASPARVNEFAPAQAKPLAGARVLIDYAHNPAAVSGLVDMVRRMPAARRVAVVTAPGDRRDEDLIEVGRLCAAFDAVILKEDTDTRGRAPGAIAALLRRGLHAGGLDDTRIDAIAEETAAVEALFERIGAGDLGVVLADDVRAVLEQARRLGGVG